jgi:hypothetical protein
LSPPIGVFKLLGALSPDFAPPPVGEPLGPPAGPPTIGPPPLPAGPPVELGGLVVTGMSIFVSPVWSALGPTSLGPDGTLPSFSPVTLSCNDSPR